MELIEFFKINSFHDGYITKVYFDTRGMLKVNIVQLIGELSIDNYKIEDINDDDQVELEVKVTGIDYICHEDNDYLGAEIIAVEVGSINKYDIILVKLYNCKNDMIYREIYVRGNNLQITSEIIGKISDDI